MRMGRYKLDQAGEPIECDDLREWASWFQDEPKDRIVCKEKVGESLVSTVFLALDHQFGDGPPVLWETLVFEGPWGGQMDRCCGTRANAMAMHRRMVELVKTEKKGGSDAQGQRDQE